MSYRYNIFTGKLDLVGSGSSGTVGDENFSYETVAREVTIPINQQMIVFGQIKIEDTLILSGSVVLI